MWSWPEMLTGPGHSEVNLGTDTDGRIVSSKILDTPVKIKRELITAFKKAKPKT